MIAVVYFFVHALLVLVYINLVFRPPEYYEGLYPRVRDIIILGIVILSYLKISYARKALIIVAIEKICEILYFFITTGIYFGLLGLAFWGLVIFYALSKRWDYLYSKWGAFESNTR